jgi:hypothetical protein
MPRPCKVRPDLTELATMWQVSDELWAVIAPILQELDPPNATGHPRVDARDTARDHLSTAERLPMEPVARTLPR